MDFTSAGLLYLGCAIGMCAGIQWRFRRQRRALIEAVHAERWAHIADMTAEELEAYVVSQTHLGLLTRLEGFRRGFPPATAFLPLLYVTLGYWGLQGCWWGGSALYAWVTTPSAAQVFSSSQPIQPGVITPNVLPLEMVVSNIMNYLMPFAGLVLLLTIATRLFIGR